MPTSPARLRAGDEVRVIAPAESMVVLSADVRTRATQRLRAMGLNVTFGRHVLDYDADLSAAIDARIADLHDAFEAPRVRCILTVIGGSNSHELLPFINFDLVRDNPKVLCGYSDITVLSCAMLCQADLITYSGPHYSSFGMRRHFGYSESMFTTCLFDDARFEVPPSPTWSDDAWYRDQEDRVFLPVSGWWVLRRGCAEGRIVGGNLPTMARLRGTAFMPSLDGAMLFLEAGGGGIAGEFERALADIVRSDGFDAVRGLVIGRFQRESRIDREWLARLISTLGIHDVPVVANADFGHTSPMFTFPIGGRASVDASLEVPLLHITSH